MNSYYEYDNCVLMYRFKRIFLSDISKHTLLCVFTCINDFRYFGRYLLLCTCIYVVKL